MNEDIYKIILERRKEAPNCKICGVKLFNGLNCLEDYLYVENNCGRLSKEEVWYWYDVLNEQYPYKKEDHNLALHHVSYNDNETIPVCYKCHYKIHNGEYPKYLPRDTKPLKIEKPYKRVILDE